MNMIKKELKAFAKKGVQWDGLLLNLNCCPFFGQYGDGELPAFKLGEAHGPDYSSRC